MIPVFPSHPSVPLACSIALLCGFSHAQDAKIRTRIKGDTENLLTGQNVTLAVDLLAPGYFDSAASFDLPDPQGVLLVPPLEHPVVGNETIDGVEYTVQSHELRAYPMRAGDLSIPAFSVRFAFKHAPLDTTNVPANLTTGALPLTVKSPPGAENLGQVISARDLTVTETWKPEPGDDDVMAGTAFTRTVTFAAPDVPAMLFPPFPAGRIDGLGIYPKQQVLDRSERGTLRGERRDTISYVCQSPGRHIIPAVRFSWYDLDAKQLRDVDLPERVLNVIANPAMASAAGETADAPPSSVPRAVLVLAAVLGAALPFFIPRVRRTLAAWIAPLKPVHLEPLNPPPSRAEPPQRP